MDESASTEVIDMNRAVAQRWIVSLVVMSLFLGACGAGSSGEAPEAAAGAEGVPIGGEEPTAPSSASDGPLTATADSAISVQLSWEPVNGATGYDVEFSMGGGDRILLATLDGSATRFEDFGVPEGEPLTYHLTAQGTGATYSVTVASEIAPANPYTVEPVLEMGGLPFQGLDPATFDFENFDPSTFDPSMFEGLDPMALLQPPGTAADIGPDGGELAVESASGARYTLVLPAGALDELTHIRMTPVESLGGYPFSGKVYGAVLIEPAGLELNQLATLVIEPSAEASSATGAEALVDIAFAFGVQGEDFHLTPLAAGEGIASLGSHAKLARPAPAGPLAGIKMYELQPQGAGQAKPEEVRQFAKKNTPGGGARRAAQNLAAAQAQDEELAEIKPTQQGKVRAQAQAARTCKQIIAAFRAYQALMAGGKRGDAAFNSQTLADLASKAKSVLARENQKCLKPDDCAKALAQVLASAGEKSPINECQLELRMESYLKYQTEKRGTGEVFVKATIPLTWAYEASGEEGENMAYLKGKGNVAYVDLSVDGFKCTVTFSSRPAGSTKFFVHKLLPRFNDTRSDSALVEDFEMLDWVIWAMQNDFKARCPSGARQTVLAEVGGGGCDFWCMAFGAARIDSPFPDDWTIHSQGESVGVVATKEYRRLIPSPVGKGGLTENTVFKLVRVR